MSGTPDYPASGILHVQVAEDCTLDSGVWNLTTDQHGTTTAHISPPSVPMFRQLVEYLEDKLVPPGMSVSFRQACVKLKAAYVIVVPWCFPGGAVTRCDMDGSGKPKREEAREFWEAAVRLWSEGGLSVREFCRCEGLAENSFYSWRRALHPENRQAEAGKKPPAGGRVRGDGRRQRQGKKVVADEAAACEPETRNDKLAKDVGAGFIELAPPVSAGVGCCTLELENAGGAKMRVELRGFAATDVALIGRSFWRVEP